MGSKEEAKPVLALLPYFVIWLLDRFSNLRVGFAAAQREIDEVAYSDSERNKAKRRSGPGFRFVCNAGNRAERCDKPNRSTHQKNRVSTRTGRRRHFRLEWNRSTARNGRSAFIGTQLLHPVIGVHSGHGNAQRENHRRQTNQTANVAHISISF